MSSESVVYIFPLLKKEKDKYLWCRISRMQSADKPSVILIPSGHLLYMLMGFLI